MAKAKIAFIGLGNMGAPMVQNLVKRGHDVRAYDISSVARDSAAKTGVTVVSSLEEALSGANMVVSMLCASEHVQALYLGTDTADNNNPNKGLFEQLSKGTLVIDCSTIAVEQAKSLAAQANKLGIDYVDAPVSGSIGGARVAKLTFLVGSNDTLYAKVKPILMCMGTKVHHAGPSGAGQAAKICNNMMLGIMMSGAAETLNLGRKNGVDPAVLTDIMIHNSGRNWAIEVYNPYPEVMSVGVPSNRNYVNGFSSANMYKDLNLALQVAQASGAKLPMGARATEVYKAHMEEHGDKDFSSIMALHDPSVLDR